MSHRYPSQDNIQWSISTDQDAVNERLRQELSSSNIAKVEEVSHRYNLITCFDNLFMTDVGVIRRTKNIIEELREYLGYNSSIDIFLEHLTIFNATYNNSKKTQSILMILYNEDILSEDIITRYAEEQQHYEVLTWLATESE